MKEQNNNFVTSINKRAVIEFAILSLEVMLFTVDKKYCNQN